MRAETVDRRAQVVQLGVVDEDEAVVEVVGEAGNGKTAVELAKRTRPDVILMDLAMPKMNGTAATAAVKAFDSAIKVLILTSFPDIDEIGRALDAKADGVLQIFTARAFGAS